MWALVHSLSTSSNQDSPLHTRHTQRKPNAFRQYCRVCEHPTYLLWPFPALRCVKSLWPNAISPRCLQTCREPPISQFREATVEQKSKLETRDTLRTVQATSKRSKTKLMKKHNTLSHHAVFLDCKGGFHVEGPMLSSDYTTRRTT